VGSLDANGLLNGAAASRRGCSVGPQSPWACSGHLPPRCTDSGGRRGDDGSGKGSQGWREAPPRGGPPGALSVAPRRIRRRRGRPLRRRTAAANASSQDVGRPVVRVPRFDHVAALRASSHNFRSLLGCMCNPGHSRFTSIITCKISIYGTITCIEGTKWSNFFLKVTYGAVIFAKTHM
jgi:hypothetical protein